MPNDAQLPPRRARRVILESPDLCRRLRVGGLWDRGRVRDDVPDAARRYAHMDDVVAALLERVERLERAHQVAVTLAKATTHGAIRQGLRLTTIRGSRALQMDGGSVLLFRRDAQGEYQVELAPVIVPAPLTFHIIVNGALIAPENEPASEVPDGICAGRKEGETVRQVPGSVRVDLLCIYPDEDGVELLLLLGGPTTVNRLDDVSDVPSPAIPTVERGSVLPLYRVVTRAGTAGVSQVVQVANRVNGV